MTPLSLSFLINPLFNPDSSPQSPPSAFKSTQSMRTKHPLTSGQDYSPQVPSSSKRARLQSEHDPHSHLSKTQDKLLQEKISYFQRGQGKIKCLVKKYSHDSCEKPAIALMLALDRVQAPFPQKIADILNTKIMIYINDSPFKTCTLEEWYKEGDWINFEQLTWILSDLNIPTSIKAYYRSNSSRKNEQLSTAMEKVTVKSTSEIFQDIKQHLDTTKQPVILLTPNQAIKAFYIIVDGCVTIEGKEYVDIREATEGTHRLNVSSFERFLNQDPLITIRINS